MIGADKGQTPALDGQNLRIGVVQARFNEGVTDALHLACVTELAVLGVRAENIVHVTVPGALEVPLALQTMARSGDGRYDALIALAASSVARPTTLNWWPTNRALASRACRWTTASPSPTPS